jgi:uncharacterized phage infection (PIP) family protein YhgE
LHVTISSQVMADPFSTFSAALSVLDVSGHTLAKAIDLICNWKNAPALILALLNETANLNIVIDQIRDTRQTVQDHNKQHNTDFISALDAQLQKARDHLGELETLVDNLKCGKSIVRRNK